MDFFTKLGDTIVEAGDTITSKAKEVSEITKLHAKIRTDEAAIKDSYEKIGRKVCELEENEVLPDFTEEKQTVERMKNDIALCWDYIRAIKGVQICPSCGAEVEEDSTYCKACGAKITE